MPDPYAVLGVSRDADDAAVRARYLQLTRDFPPEHHPEKSAAIRGAYEQLATVAARARHRLFGGEEDETLESMIEASRNRLSARRIALNDLFRMAGVSGR